MIKEAEHWLKIAINDQYWHKILPKISIPIRLGRLPAEILRETSINPLLSGNECVATAEIPLHIRISAPHLDPLRNGDECLTTAEIPLHLRISAASITDANSITGQLIKSAQAAKRQQHHLEPAKVTTKKTKNSKKTPEQSVAAESKLRSAADTLRRSEKAARHDRLQEGEVIDLIDGDPRSAPASRKRKRPTAEAGGVANRDRRPALPVPPEVHALELGFTTVSSKLDWVVGEVLKCDEDRFLVFAKDSVMLGQLTEVRAHSPATLRRTD